MTTADDQPPINTDGGAYIPGSVNTGGGAFAGRDLYYGQYERLQEAVLDPRSVFTRVQLDHFAGREWLTDEVDAFLGMHDRGYFILEASAGLGKTTFMAHLVQSRGYLHFFAEQARGQDGLGAALKSLAAQIILRWNLDPQGVHGVLPSGATRPDFLSSLLFDAAENRDKNQTGTPIVLVIDSLDEAGTPSGHNVLSLPQVLPKGVFILVSQRPIPVALTIDHPWQRLRLRADADENIGDMNQYLQMVVLSPPMQEGLRSGHRSPDEIINALLARAHGVWIYLFYVVNEPINGHRAIGDMQSLPDGLEAYYADFWRRLRNSDLTPRIAGSASSSVLSEQCKRMLLLIS